MNPIRLYLFDASPPARAVQMTAAALGIKLELRRVNTAGGENLTPEFLKMNPQHTVPTVEDNGTIVWDSHAINAYLVRKYAKDDSLYPKDFAKRAMVDQRLHFDSGVLFSILRTMGRSIKFKGVKQVSPEWREQTHEGYQFLEEFLKGRKFAIGDNPTIADMSLLSSVTTLDILVPVENKYPNIVAWIKRAESQPWYKINVPGLEEYRRTMREKMSS